MKNKPIVRTLTRAWFMLSLIFLISCDDSDDKAGSEIELLSFGPTGVQHGEEIVFIGTNLDEVESIVFQPNVEVTKDQFTSVKNNEIRLVVPTAVESGKVMLKTPSGDIESKSIFSLEVLVEITDFTAEAKPGTNITITGEYLNWVESIEFNDGVTVEEFVSQSLHELVVTVPMEAKTGFLKFVTGGTEPLEITTEEPLTVALPEVTQLTPASIRHAQDLTLTGTDLDLVTQIAFPGGAVLEKADFESQTETQIVVTVPVTATDGKLTLTAPSGVEIETSALTILLPKVTAFNPSNTSLHTEGADLDLIGTDLDLVSEIKFPGVPTAVTVFDKTATQIDVVIPAGAQGGTMVLKTIHGFTVPVAVPFGNQLTLATVIYDDAIKTPLGPGGGWGGVVTDANNAENVRLGSKSIKVTFAGSWGGGGQFGNWSTGGTFSTAGATYFALSVYGGSGTDGKKINVNVSGQQAAVTIKEGQWVDAQIPLSSVGSPAGIAEIWFQDQGFSGTVWIDHIGLK